MSTIENKDLINTDNISTQYGLFAGVLMAVSLLLFQLAGLDYSPFLKLSKYLLLAIPIVVALNIYKKKLKEDVFVKGFSLGAKLSMAAGLSLVVINLIIFAISPEYSFSKYTIEPTSLSQVTLISSVLFIEVFVIGSIITFITLQYLKEKSRR